jgi:rhamnose transport system permease protein
VGALVAEQAGQPSGGAGRLAGLLRWETLLAAVLLALIVLGTLVSSAFLTNRNVSNLMSALIEVAIMSLPMAFVIIAGEIDLSVESMAGLSSSVLGFLFAAGVPIELGIPIVLAIGAAGGLLNGLLVTRAGLPSLVVTLGTLALFRGMALIVLGPRGISGFPDWFTTFGFNAIPGTPVPWTLIPYIVLALVLGIVLHRTWIGRQLYATGKTVAAARFSGVRVARLKLLLFVMSGTVAALAGVILSARFASARADLGQGMTLTVVTIVLLGGVNIFGGSGTIPGVVLAAATLAVLGNVLRLTNVSAELQSIAIGLLLIVSVVIPTFAHQARSAVDRVRGGRPPPIGSATHGEAALQ